MNEDIKWLTVLDVEKQTGIPNATIRRYIRNHSHHLNIRKKGKSYYIASESLPTMLNIRQLYDDGKNLEQVEEALIQSDNPVIITVTTDDKQVTVNLGEALQDMKLAMNEQNIIIQSLIEQIQKQQEYIDNKLEERDKNLIAAIKESQESKKQMATTLNPEKTNLPSTQQEKKWYQFWK